METPGWSDPPGNLVTVLFPLELHIISLDPYTNVSVYNESIPLERKRIRDGHHTTGRKHD